MFSFAEEITKRAIKNIGLFMVIMILSLIHVENLFLEDLRIFCMAALLISLILCWDYELRRSLPTRKLQNQITAVTVFMITAISIEFFGAMFLADSSFLKMWRFLYLLAYLLIPVCSCLIINNPDCRFFGLKRRIFVSLTCFAIPLVWILYYRYLPVLFGNLALPPLAGFCTSYVLFLQYCIYKGDLPTYSFYNEIFKKGSIEAILYDHEDRVVFSSENAQPFDQDKIELLKEEALSLRDGDYEIHSRILPGGYALWRMDVKEQANILRELEDIRKQLSEEYHFLEEESMANHKLAQIREKSHLYNRISKELRPKSERLLALFSQIEELVRQGLPYQETLKKALVFAVYIKRKSNLILLSEIHQAMTSTELGLCFRESLKYLSSCKINCSYYILDDYLLNPEIVYCFYDCFEEVIEGLIDELEDFYVSVRVNEATALMRMEFELKSGTVKSLDDFMPPDYLKSVCCSKACARGESSDDSQTWARPGTISEVTSSDHKGYNSALELTHEDSTHFLTILCKRN